MSFDLNTVLTLLGSFFSPGGILAGAVTVAAGFVTPYIVNWLHLAANDARRSLIQDAISNALKYAVSVVAKNPNNTELLAVKDDVIAIAKAYLNDLVPEALAALKIVDDGQLTKILEAALASELDNLSALLGTHLQANVAAVKLTNPTFKK